MKIAISSGHGQYIRGASASPRPPYLDEYDENVRVSDRVNQLLNANGVTCVVFHDTTSTSQNQNLSTIVSWPNRQSRDLDISVHFNAYQKTSSKMGVEVLYVTQSSLASSLSSAMASVMNLPNRGGKYRSDLYFLNNTSKPAILIETCFVDSSADGEAYRAKFEDVCKRIAEVVGKITIGGEPVEPPTEPPPTEPPTEQEVARIDITIAASGGPCVISINGQDFQFNMPGPEEPSEPVFQDNHSNIICTVFGGSSDPNSSAYPPYDTITDTEISCALPYKWSGARPQVLVHNLATGKDVVCNVRDVGPWMIDDEAYVLGDDRPIAEPAGSKIPSGKNQGMTSNGAGIDLTPGAAKAIGLSGKGNVHWRFLEEGEDVA